MILPECTPDSYCLTHSTVWRKMLKFEIVRQFFIYFWPDVCVEGSAFLLLALPRAKL